MLRTILLLAILMGITQLSFAQTAEFDGRVRSMNGLLKVYSATGDKGAAGTCMGLDGIVRSMEGLLSKKPANSKEADAKVNELKTKLAAMQKTKHCRRDLNGCNCADSVRAFNVFMKKQGWK